MKLLIAIAVGGAFGAIARYKITSWMGGLGGTGFPWGTLFVNVAGGLLMGLVLEGLASRGQTDPALKAFLLTGMLGAFTTFSAFSLDVVTLVERQQLLLAGGYVTASVGASVVALFMGILIKRWALS
jgi:CrcB protein